MRKMIIKLAGTSFGDAQENINKFGYKDIYWYGLRREPRNPHDSNAISIHCIGYHMGYVPKETAYILAHKMDAGEEYEARFISRNVSPYHTMVGLTVEIIPATNQSEVRSDGNEI